MKMYTIYYIYEIYYYIYITYILLSNLTPPYSILQPHNQTKPIIKLVLKDHYANNE